MNADPSPKAEDPGTVPCSNCGKPMPEERRDLLNVTTCIQCTKPKKKPIGTWDYPEGFHERMEGVGGLVILDGE
jgi:hypothetical protein